MVVRDGAQPTHCKGAAVKWKYEEDVLDDIARDGGRLDRDKVEALRAIAEQLEQGVTVLEAIHAELVLQTNAAVPALEQRVERDQVGEKAICHNSTLSDPARAPSRR